MTAPLFSLATPLSATADAGFGSDVIAGLIDRIVSIAIGGVGPYQPARTVADRAVADTANADEAIESLVRRHLVGTGAGGFVTALGGFATMAIAIPLNLLEFYVQASRLVASVAVVHRYDIDDDDVRAAIANCLFGTESEAVLTRAGVGIGGFAGVALSRLPAPVLSVANKAVAFRLGRRLVPAVLGRLSRFAPAVGGFIGAGVDMWMLSQIATAARRDFPPRDATA